MKVLESISNMCTTLLVRCLLVIVPLFFVYRKGKHYYFSIYDIFKEVILESIAAFLVVFMLLKLFAQDERTIAVKQSPLTWPLLTFLGVLLVGVTRAFSIPEWFFDIRIWLGNFIIIFIVYQSITTKQQIFNFIHWFIFAGACVALYGILQRFHIEFPELHQNFIGNSFSGNPNFASEYILVVFPVALLLCFSATHRGLFMYYLVTTLLMGAFIIFNKSRAVWIGGGIGAFLISMYVSVSWMKKRLVFHFGKNERQHSLFVLKCFFVVIGMACAVIVISCTPLHVHHPTLLQINRSVKQVIREVGTLKELKLAKGEIVRGDTATQRLLIWRNTLRMVRAYSVLGVGLGSGKILYQPYRTEDEQKATGPDIFVRQSHNEYVQMLSESGLFGIAIFFWIIITAFRMCGKLMRQSSDFTGQCLGLGYMLSLTSTFIAIFFNFTLHTPEPMMALCFVLCLLMATYDVYMKETMMMPRLTAFFKEIKKSVRWGLVGAAAIFFVLPYWIVYPARAYYAYQFGQALEQMGLLNEARQQLEKSIALEPFSWETHFVLANVYASLGDMMRSKEHHRISLDLNPYHQKGYYNYANTLYKLGDIEESIVNYRQAVLVDPIFHQAYNNLGTIYFKQNKLDESLACFRAVTKLDPGYASGQYNVGYILYLQKKYQEALPYIREAYRLNPGDEKIQSLMRNIQKHFGANQ